MSDELIEVIRTAGSIRATDTKGTTPRRVGMFGPHADGSVVIEIERESGLTIEAVRVSDPAAMRYMAEWMIAAANNAERGETT